MDDAIRDYTQRYKAQDQKLFQAIINLRKGIKEPLNRYTAYLKDISTQLYTE